MPLGLARLAFVLAVAVAAVAPLAAAAGAQTREQLEEQKLRAEIRKLELENASANSLREDVLAWAPFITVLVAVAGVTIPVLRQIRDQQQHQREEELKQRTLQEEELTQRKLEAQRRFDEQYAQAIANLGSETELVQVGGVVSLGSFLRPEYVEFHEQVYSLLYANLTVEHSPLLNRFLVPVFAKAVRIHLTSAREQGVTPELVFVRCSLPRVDLSDLDLTGIDLAFANLSYANLTGCRLFRARGIEVNLERARLSRADAREIRFHKAHCKDAQFHEAELISAELREADLRGAEFFRARLQGAHLDRADLRGARFEQAVLADTFFGGATFDEPALRSIVRASSWRQAHFSPDVEAALVSLK